MKKWVELLEGPKLTCLAGFFLIISLTLTLTETNFSFDPAWLTVIISGIPMLYLALTRLFYEKWISSALLISIAMLASISIGEIFAAGEVAFIMALGAILENMTIARAQKGLAKLIALAPQTARRLITTPNQNSEEIIPLTAIKTNDIIRVIAGEQIPVDGIVIAGNSSVDQAVITGESLPIDKEIGSKVFCGTLNCFGAIDIKATNVGADSSLQKLIALIKEAENKKAPLQRIADKWAVWLVPLALFIAIGAYFFNIYLGHTELTALNRSVTVLVVFCPCALALATPVSIMAAIGQATKQGVIIKSGEALEAMGSVSTIAFDKTGTLTMGKLSITDVLPLTNTITSENILTLAATAESKSEHPLGKAIVAYTQNLQLKLLDSHDFEMHAGQGVSAKISDQKIFCGNEQFIKKMNVSFDLTLEAKLSPLREQGKLVIIVANTKNILGLIALSDLLKSNAVQTVQKLSKLTKQLFLLTGDNLTTAKYFASQVGLSKVFAELLPGDKVNIIQQIQQTGEKVCMLGDGINDAPALKTADVGIAMGSMGSDIAINAADIAIMNDDLSKIIYLKQLANSTVNTIKFNITISMLINAVAVTLSVLGVLTPITGALVHNAGSVLVVLNAALLYDRKFSASF